jgi:hypothetical protein
MLCSRQITLTQLNPISSLNNQELRIAIAKEIFGWKNARLHSGGRITASHSMALTRNARKSLLD